MNGAIFRCIHKADTHNMYSDEIAFLYIPFVFTKAHCIDSLVCQAMLQRRHFFFLQREELQSHTRSAPESSRAATTLEPETTMDIPKIQTDSKEDIQFLINQLQHAANDATQNHFSTNPTDEHTQAQVRKLMDQVSSVIRSTQSASPCHSPIPHYPCSG